MRNANPMRKNYSLSMKISHSIVKSPIGNIYITGTSQAIIEVCVRKPRQIFEENALTKKCKKQIDEYFAGKRQVFDLPIQAIGTEFQMKVWKCMAKIPFGKTLNYGDIARKIAHPKASRAVGAACGKNPILIILPCHRVVGVGNKITGFAAGIPKKIKLLAHEGPQMNL